ncbi:MAG: lipopolysaccharide transport periplasmic protein LptA [Ectothiorhodospiraceae bacterium]
MKRATEWRRRPAQIAASAALAVAWLAAPAGAPAAEPIQLDADEAEIDNASGVSVYTGNVVLTRGGRRITGDRMTVHLREDRSDQTLDHVVVEGEPAVYRHTGTEERRPVEAEAPRMEYYAGNPERVILLQGGTLTQGRNTFSGRRIDYNVTADAVDATSDGDRDGQGDTDRVRATFYPEDEDGEDDE